MFCFSMLTLEIIKTRPNVFLKIFFFKLPVTIFFNKVIYLLIFAALGLLLHAGFSLVAAGGGYSLLWCAGFSLWWLLLLWSKDSRREGFSSCGTWAQYLWLLGSRAQAQ